MNDIKITNDGCTAIVDGAEYPIHCFNIDGDEALVIHDWDLISYDDGDTWKDMD